MAEFLITQVKTVVGVDGCAGGWVCLALNIGTRQISANLLPDFRAVLEAFPAAVIGVDIPIGLPDKGSRQCDLDARRLLRKRGSSVFPAPVRGVLKATTYEEACRLGRQIENRAMSCQCYGILPKIRGVDCGITPELQRRVFEVHPEVCFWALNHGTPMEHRKTAPEGKTQRVGLLRPVTPDIEHVHITGAKNDDILDAAVVMWTAERIFRGQAAGVTKVEEVDSKGLRMQITY